MRQTKFCSATGLLLGLLLGLWLAGCVSAPRGQFQAAGSATPNATAAAIADMTTATPVVTPVDLSHLSPRAGMGVSTQADVVVWASRLGAGWYMNWQTGEPLSALPEFWQTVRIHPKEDPQGVKPAAAECAQLAARWPGGVWIIGNEPDNIWQDNTTAEDYARIYHEYYTAIKAADPTAKIAVAGVSAATPLRLAYLDRVLAVYQESYGQTMPVDWWTLHNYVLREERGSWGVDIPPGFEQDSGLLIEPEQHGDLALFEDGIRTFRAWMAQNGYRDRPLALTEFGILLPEDFGYTPEVVSQYLADSFHWLDQTVDAQTGDPNDGNRLVQRWAWFSLADKTYPTADLANLDEDRLTRVGEAFHTYVMENERK